MHRPAGSWPVPSRFLAGASSTGGTSEVHIRWRKRKGIEPSKRTLARRFIGFEDRGRHQSGTRFHWRSYTDFIARVSYSMSMLS